HYSPTAATFPLSLHDALPIFQGSSDVPTLFDLLPGYLPMPHAHEEDDLRSYVLATGFPQKGFWSHMQDYTVSLLKAWWGEHATRSEEHTSELQSRFDLVCRLR